MQFLNNLTDTVISLGKLIVQSKGCGRMPQAAPGRRLVVLGNGPSLRGLIDSGLLATADVDKLAVNFAANTDEFVALRPQYYVIADPHFFKNTTDANVARLIDNMNRRVGWKMTLFVPASERKSVAIDNPEISVCPYNCVGIEGFASVKQMAFSSRRGMPRPRNVLIPSLMLALWMGYKTIYVAGADHSWMRTLEVNERNEVVSVQPHFYADNDHETSRITSVYKGVRLHEVIHSFYVAFKAYFEIDRFATTLGAHIYNITPGSFIDAFERREAESIGTDRD